MKNLAIYFIAFVFCFIIPSFASAQPVTPHHGPQINYYYPRAPHTVPYGYTYRCYIELFPAPHELCEYIRVITPTPRPLPRHFQPGPQPAFRPAPLAPNHRPPQPHPGNGRHPAPHR